MASQKPTPEEKLFSVIQGAKSPLIRKPPRSFSAAAAGRRMLAVAASVDLPQISLALQLGMGYFIVLIAVQFLGLPSVERLIIRSPAPAAFRIEQPLEGLRPIDDYLPDVLAQDPFRVGQTPVVAPEAAAAVTPADAPALLDGLRLVGIAWSDVPTAMIEQSGQTYFLKQGELLGAVTVKEILRDRVIITDGIRDAELF